MFSLCILGIMMEIRFDKKTNRIVVDIGLKNEAGDKDVVIEIAPQDIRDILPVKDEAQKLDDLKMILHDIKRERLTKMETYMRKMAKLADDMGEARDELKECSDMICVKKWTAVVKSFIDESFSP